MLLQILIGKAVFYLIAEGVAVGGDTAHIPLGMRKQCRQRWVLELIPTPAMHEDSRSLDLLVLAVCEIRVSTRRGVGDLASCEALLIPSILSIGLGSILHRLSSAACSSAAIKSTGWKLHPEDAMVHWSMFTGFWWRQGTR